MLGASLEGGGAMPIRVRIPTALRGKAEGTTQIEVQAGVVSEALEELETAYPALSPVLRDERGALRPRVSVYVNDRHVRFLQGLETPLREGDEVYVVPVVMGG
jgi:molybdopterin converting factor small subunit